MSHQCEMACAAKASGASGQIATQMLEFRQRPSTPRHRRIPTLGELVREETRFRPWLVLDRLDDLPHLGARLGPDGCERAPITYCELDGAEREQYLCRDETRGAVLAA